MIVYIGATLLAVIILRWILSPDPKSKCGIYVQPNKWYPAKYMLLRVLLLLRQRQNRNQKQTSGQNAGYGVRSRNTPEDMDKIQILPKDQPKAVDAIYFNGGDASGVYFVAATARRLDNIVQTILYLRLPDIGLLQLPLMPDTTLKGTEENSFAAGGLRLEVVEPMEKWRISFTGKLRIDETGKEKDVRFELDWIAKTRFFDFDTDMHPAAMADAISREKWSKGYFSTLQRLHQTHYEQFGEITGCVQIDGYDPIELKLLGVRDHSYGNVRDWKYFHRYAIQYISLTDGTFICIGAVSMPMAMSRITMGYVFHPDGKMDSVSSSEFEFFNFGEDGNPPKDMSFNFIAGGKVYNIRIQVVQAPMFYMGEDWDAKIHERFAVYTVNGVEGWGISEWDYRNYAGKEAEMKKLGQKV